MMINLLITSASVAGTQITFYLIHHKHFSTVRASSGATLVFTLLTLALPFPFIPTLQAAFFGSTFVGMTANNRLGKKRVLLASLLFAGIYIFALPYLQGIGGGLGTAAFVASSVVYLIFRYTKYKKN